ncbi:MAG: glycosyltransferase family 4 protein [Verrucomicrobiota bacterium]
MCANRASGPLQLALPSLNRRVTELAYVFERFPSYVQTFCYREVSELQRQGAALTIFSIRRPENEPPQDWDRRLIETVHYLPGEAELREEISSGVRKGLLPKNVARQIEKWGRQPDFLRLYQAAYIGMRLQERNLTHVHAHFAGLAARTVFWIKEFFGIPYSFTAHANDIFAPRPFAVGLDKLINSASAVVTETDYSAALLRTQFPQNSEKILRVYNGINVSLFQRSRFDAPIPLIISVGRLVEKKGFAHLIEACRRLKERGLDFSCEIIGEGPLEDSLRAQIVKSKLEALVSLRGAQSQGEIVQRLSAATVFCLPCVVEKGGGMDNLPTVIAEAMASGLPVVSTPIAGVPEMVVNKVSGFLVSPGDPTALADALNKAMADKELAQRFGEQGRKRASELFSIETTARSLRELFECLLANADSAPSETV